MDGASAIQALATAVDTKLGVAAAGQALTPVPTALNQSVSVAVTFPVGRFTVAPICLATGYGGGTALGPTQVANPTTTGVTVYGYRVSGGLGAITINWFAIQV
jgi:hypothetical protein